MPRIVDVNHLKLSVDRNGTDLSVSGQAVTYRFIEEQPEKTRAGGRR